MDEIIIDDKKYVSSKRAAKVTGYAKDYIGQLCREGRVSARLVGRSWYVLESAIHDHRFGSLPNHVVESTQTPREKKEEPPIFHSTWEAPRYEAASVDLLPSINRLKNATFTGQTDKNVSEPIHAPEQAGVDDVATIESDATREPVKNQLSNVETRSDYILEDDEVSVPVHTVYDLPPQSLLPRRNTDEQKDGGSGDDNVLPHSSYYGSLRVALTAIAIVICITSTILAILSTGVFDSLAISSKIIMQASGLQVVY